MTQVEGEREKILNRVPTQHGFQHRAQYHDPETMTQAKIKSKVPN